MKVSGVLWSAVALFLAFPVTCAAPDDAQHFHQPANDTQALPKPEALIGARHWPRRPIRVPLITPACRGPPLPHTLYTHALDRIQRGKSTLREIPEAGDARRRSNWAERGLLGPLHDRSVHSMTAEESWTLLGYPYSRSRVSLGMPHQSTKGRGRPGYTRGPGKVHLHQVIRPVRLRPFSPTPATRPHASIRPRFPSRPWIPSSRPSLRSHSHPRVPINSRPLPHPRPPLTDAKPTPTPRTPATLTPDPLSVHNVAGPPYFNTVPPHILGRSDATTTTTTTTTTTSPFSNNEVWVTPYDLWQPPPSITTTTTTNRPSFTATPDEDVRDPWGSFGDADWLNKWGHGWDNTWPSDWSTKRDPAPTDVKDPSSSPEVFPSMKDINTPDTYEDYENYVPEETLIESLLKNHRFPDKTTPHPRHDSQQTTSTPLHQYYDGVSDGVPHSTTTSHSLSELPLTVSRYSEIPLSRPKPHKNRGSFPVKHKHSHPPRPFVRHREEPHGKDKPLTPPHLEQPLGGRIPLSRTHKETHNAELTEWTTVPWRASYPGMVPVATRRRLRCALCHQ